MANDFHNKLVYKIHDKQLAKFAALHAHGKLLDIGCGIKPYRDIFKCYVTEHLGVDHEDSIHSKVNVDLVGTAYDIPSANAVFDTVLCTAVLEHLENPEQALRECNRVLKQGGKAIYSVPFIWHLHEEPRDFYRFTKYGLSYLFEKCGFEIVEIKALSGFWVTFGQLLIYNLYRLNRGPLKRLHVIDVIGLPLQGLFYLLDRIDRTEQWTWAYMVVARKL